MYIVTWENHGLWDINGDSVNSEVFNSVKSAMDFTILLILNRFNPIVVKVNGNVISKVL